MTASLQSTAFLAKLLAPLPEGEEQVSTPKYLRQVQNDITLPWRKGMEHVELAEARHTVSALERRLGIESSHLPSIITWRALVEAWRRQCLIPAPSVIWTFSGFQSVNPFTGPPDQDRHEPQWQYPIPSGSPKVSILTVPQKHSPAYVIVGLPKKRVKTTA